MIDFTKIFRLKGLKPKNKGHTNFYECCNLMKKVYLKTVYFSFFLTHSIWGLLFNSTSIRKFYVHFPIFLHLDNTEVTGTSSVFFLYIHEKGSPCRRIVDLNFFPSPKKKVKQHVKVNASQESSRIYWRYRSTERLHCVCNWSPNIAWGGTGKLYLILEILEFIIVDIQKILYNIFWAFF